MEPGSEALIDTYSVGSEQWHFFRTNIVCQPAVAVPILLAANI